MNPYTFEVISTEEGVTTLKIGFGAPATNSEIVSWLNEAIFPDVSGKGLLVNGPASLPVAMWLSHKVAHLVGFVGVFDPKLAGYVVCVSHTPDHAVGDVIPQN